MGTYLSTPVTEKDSTDEANEKLICGTSSMQGWRVSQEDAHNCIIDFDTNTSFFAVYDGHGGHEVALYCSQKLPEFLKELEHYKNANLVKALEDAFLQFDATIATEEVITKLKEIARDRGDKEGDEDSDEDEENVNNLYEEAAMPIEQVIEKYTSIPAFKTYLKARDALKNEASTINSTPTKDIVHTSEGSGNVVSSSSCVKNDVISSSNDNSTKENPVSSGESSEVNSDAKIENKVDSPDSSGDTKEVCTPSNNSNEKEVVNQNGEVESTQNCEGSKSDVSSSSTTPHENGEVVKKGKGKALTKTKGVVPKIPTPQRPKRTARQFYNNILSLDDGSEEDSEDEKDETFEGPNEDSTDDEDVEALDGVEDNSDTSVEEEDGEEEDDDDDEEEEEEEEDDEDDDQKDLKDEDDNFLYSMKEEPGSDSGCTAVVGLLRGNELYVANAGDSRCVVCRNGQAIEMSIDHKPEDKLEETRIVNAGGYLSREGRVNGGLNLSRAIGDHAYKQNKNLSDREQMITALPDVKTLTIKPEEDEFMILACDGIWNSMSSQEVVDFIKPRLQEGTLKLSQICEQIFEHCMAPGRYAWTLNDGTGCDNMTAIIVQFKRNAKRSASTEPEESDQCKKLKTEETEVSA